ncbi:hypothetical protein RB3370 [Rhodopirellula baltica SH 1]|uniref:Uncharacterized protein n=1 Tax=Rhodopirellula baltica (strain DSM 10527 / NCIMB 13988 / SH1) TaxID=243090 RepID=Q7UUC8_RHOBA|nr:hypothetical protein RB3370 [Rhodopirellula baltica SH 1]
MGNSLVPMIPFWQPINLPLDRSNQHKQDVAFTIGSVPRMLRHLRERRDITSKLVLLTSG